MMKRSSRTLVDLRSLEVCAHCIDRRGSDAHKGGHIFRFLAG